MYKKHLKIFTWDFGSKLIILSFFFLGVLRWQILPQFMDMYYHLLTALGFTWAGGYSGWDFWQYAPAGRIHIYPPVFHLVLAFLIKIGIGKIILLKLFELIVPILFLLTIYYFVRKNFGHTLCFFILLISSSSFSFYHSLSLNLPATLAIIFGLLCLDRFLRKEFLRSFLLLSLCFYTHIGVSWVFAFSVILYALFDKAYRKLGLLVFISAVTLSSPIIFKQLVGLKFISLSGISEKYFCEFKIAEYFLAFFGLAASFKNKGKYFLLVSLFLASLIFIAYPFRFFSAQGFLPIIFLSGVSLDFLWDKLREKSVFLKYPFFLAIVGYVLFFSPTILMDKSHKSTHINYKLYSLDSAFTNMLLPMDNERLSSNSLWFPSDYLPAAEIIMKNSQNDDIVYSDLHILSVCLSGLSERPCASGLLPEIGPFKEFDPFLVSKIIVLPKDENEDYVSFLTGKYGLEFIGETKMFSIYKNSTSIYKAKIRKASVNFLSIVVMAVIFVAGLFHKNLNILFDKYI